MTSEKSLIKLYRTRTFGEKISDTFDFVRENWRILLKFITYLLLPVALVQTFCSNNFMSGYMQTFAMIGSGSPDLNEMLPWLSSLALMTLTMYVGIILLTALVYTMMQEYEQRPGLQGITFADLKSGILSKIGRQVILLITSIVLYAVIIMIAALMIAISPVLILPAILIAVIALPLFVLVLPIYLFEKTGLISAYAKSIRLGWKTWAGVVGVVVVLYIVVAILQGIISTPWYLMLTVKNVLSTTGNSAGFVSSFSYTAIQYLLGVISSFVGSCLMSLIYIGIAYQYGHACDKVDGVSVDKDIENFENLNN